MSRSSQRDETHDQKGRSPCSAGREVHDLAPNCEPDSVVRNGISSEADTSPRLPSDEIHDRRGRSSSSVGPEFHQVQVVLKSMASGKGHHSGGAEVHGPRETLFL